MGVQPVLGQPPLIVLLVYQNIMEVPVTPAHQGIFCNLHQLPVLILVHQDIGRTMRITFALFVILLAQSVWMEPTVNAHLATMDIFCSRRQQYVWTLVRQQDIGRIPLITFAQLAMLLALRVQARVILNAPLAIQGIFCSRRRQYALTLVRQPDIGRTTQITFVLLAMLLVRFVQVQVILNALPANRGISYNQHLQPLRALTLVQMDIGETLQVTLVWNVIFHARFVWMGPTLNAPLVIQGTFYNHHQQYALTLVRQQDIGRTT